MELEHAVPSVFGLAVYLKKHRDTLYVWAKRFPEFQEIMSFIKTHQVHAASNGALVGSFNPKIAAMMMSQYNDYIEKISTDHTSSDGSMTPQSPVVILPAKHDAD